MLKRIPGPIQLHFEIKNGAVPEDLAQYCFVSEENYINKSGNADYLELDVTIRGYITDRFRRGQFERLPNCKVWETQDFIDPGKCFTD